jgi:hypothetical protein
MLLVLAPMLLFCGWAGQYVNVKDYGAVGDGVVDDGAAISSAILAAGTNGFVHFPAGNTFKVWRILQPLQGQTFSGYGAVLKRGGRKTATLVGSFAFNGSTNQTMVVNDASPFSVGMSFSLFQGVYPDQIYATENYTILGISGNTLQVSGSASNSSGGLTVTNQFPAGTTVSTSLTIIESAASGVKILGLELDGNAAENDLSFTRWEIHYDIHLAGDRALVRDCFVHDSQSEGIGIGGEGAAVESCRILRTAGNGIHLSGARAANIINNVIKTTNLAGSRPGHEDGNISFSINYGRILVMGNHLEDGLAGIGGQNLLSYDRIIVANNTFTNFASVAFEGNFGVGVNRIIDIHGNQFHNAGRVLLNFSDAVVVTNSGNQGVSIVNNHFVNTTVFIDNVLSGLISGNHFDCTSDLIPLYVEESKGLLITGNVVLGGAIGCLLNGFLADSVALDGNMFRNQYDVGIWTSDALNGVAVRNNSVVSEAGQASASFIGIIPGNGHLVMGNQLNLAQARSGIECPAGGAGVPGAVVSQNLIRVPPAAVSVRLYGGSQNNSIIGNFISTPISGSGGSSNTVSGNVSVF